VNESIALVAREFQLSPNHAARLRELAHVKHISQDQIIARALDILFSLTDLLEPSSERQGWSFLSEESLEQVWDNDSDAQYDNWRELYAIRTR